MSTSSRSPIAHAPQCIATDRRSCVTDASCYWSGNRCVLGSGGDASVAAHRTPAVDAEASGASASGRTPVIYSCRIDGIAGPVEGLTWVDTIKAKTGTAGSLVEDVARQRVGVGTSASATCSVAVQPKHDSNEWVQRRMAANCAPHFDINRVTTMNTFECQYEGTGVVAGKRVRRPSYSIKGRLASCDGLDEFRETSDEVMESIRLYAWHQAGGKEAQMDPDQFVCTVQSLPHS